MLANCTMADSLETARVQSDLADLPEIRRKHKSSCTLVSCTRQIFSSSPSGDLVLLVLPLAFIRHLNMRRYRKIAVGLMFSVKIFGGIATIVRLRTLLIFEISLVPTWDYIPVIIWTELKLAAAFVCLSLASIRIFLVKILPVQVKRLLSHITRPSRSRSNPTPNPDKPAGEWKKPAS